MIFRIKKYGIIQFIVFAVIFIMCDSICDEMLPLVSPDYLLDDYIINNWFQVVHREIGQYRCISCQDVFVMYIILLPWWLIDDFIDAHDCFYGIIKLKKSKKVILSIVKITIRCLFLIVLHNFFSKFDAITCFINFYSICFVILYIGFSIFQISHVKQK